MKNNFKKMVSLVIISFLIVTGNVLIFANEKVKPEDRFFSGEYIEINGEHDSAIFGMGTKEVKSKGDYKGDVFLIGNSVEISGTYSNNVYVMGNMVNIDGAEIKGNVYSVGTAVTFTNGSATDVFTAGTNVSALENFKISRDAFMSSDLINISSEIGRHLDISGGSLEIASKVSGDITADMNNFKILKDASLSGKVVNTSVNDFEIEDGATLSETPVWNEYVPESNTINLGDILKTIISIIVIWVLTKYIFPRYYNNTEIYVKSKMLEVSAMGVLSLVIFIIFSVVLIFQIMLSSALVEISIFIVTVYFGFMWISSAIALVSFVKVISNNFNAKNTLGQFLSILCISLFYCAISLVPILNLIVSLVTSLLGMGFVVYHFIYSRTEYKNQMKLLPPKLGE